MSGAAKTLISPEEHLSMSFGDREPECVRGELIYKPIPDSFHGLIQAALVWLLMNALRARGFRVMVEARSRLAEDHYRLPDVAVYPPGPPVPQLPHEPPFIAIEVVSEDERHPRLLQKLVDYRAWGVTHIWIVDPWRRQLSVFTSDGLRDVEALTLPEYEVEIRLEQLIEGLSLPS